MSGVLVVAETRRGALREISLELVATAQALSAQGAGPVTVVVVDAEPAQPAQRLAATGVAEVLTVTSPAPHFEPHLAATAVGALVAQTRPAVVLTAHSVDAMGFAPAVAAEQGLGFASDAMSVEWADGAPVVRRGAYGDRLVATVDFPGRDGVLVMVRPGAAEPAPDGAGAPIRDAGMVLDAAVAATEHLGFREPEIGDVDITKADFLLCIGRGVEDEDEVERFEELAGRLGATLTASRPLVDAGWLPASRQVGQSGKTVTPKVYLALGVSGAIQHLAGMRKADTIIAINTDPEAPIFGVADYGAVLDLFAVADALPEHFG
jgi:electron transfer flavoprotein alpha subunit